LGTAFAAGEFGFGGDEATFAGGFEHGRSVALEVGLDAPEGCYCGIQARELFFDFGHYSRLLILRCERNFDVSHVRLPDGWNRCRLTDFGKAER